MQFPAALSNLLEILSRPGALHAFVFFNTLTNSAFVIFRNSKTLFPGVTKYKGSRSIEGILLASCGPILQKKLLNSLPMFSSPVTFL